MQPLNRTVKQYTLVTRDVLNIECQVSKQQQETDRPYNAKACKEEEACRPAPQALGQDWGGHEAQNCTPTGGSKDGGYGFGPVGRRDPPAAMTAMGTADFQITLQTECGLFSVQQMCLEGSDNLCRHVSRHLSLRGHALHSIPCQ